MTVHIVVLDPDLDPEDNCVRSIDAIDPNDTLEDFHRELDPFHPQNIRSLYHHNDDNSMSEAVWRILQNWY